eukprot:8511461-Pyramimonas_sp.AAC.1
MSITTYLQEILRHPAGKSERILCVALRQCKLPGMLVDQVGTESFTFVMRHTDVVDVVELRAFAPSHPRRKRAHVE